MTSYLIIGLESSCTRYLARLVAANTTIGAVGAGWTGVEFIDDGDTKVAHRSLPHFDRFSFVTADIAETYHHVCIATRDYTCSLMSKMKHHQPDRLSAVNEHNVGIAVLRSIASKMPVHVWNYESAAILGDQYNAMFLRSMGLPADVLIPVEEVNKKHFPFWRSEHGSSLAGKGQSVGA